MTHTDLIARLQAADGPSRELDAEIWLATTPGATRKKWGYTHLASGRWCEIDETRDATHRLILVPTYTDSLDAAVSLVPNDLYYLIGRGRSHPDEPLFAAQVLDGADVVGEAEHDANAPIALVIAALLARGATP